MGKVLIIACTNVGKAIIEEICTNNNILTQVVGIVNLDQKQGINKANYHSYVDLALRYDIPLHHCDNVNDVKTIQWIKSLSPDLIIQSGWSQKFGEELLSFPKYGCIGEHPAPLPKGRGAACINWAIINGEKEWGDSFFKMVTQYDEGELYAQQYFNIEIYDTVKTIYDKVANTARLIIRYNIDRWSEGIFQSIIQDNSTASYFKRRTPSDGLFDFNKSAKEVHDFIRAQTYPYPGAFINYCGSRLKILFSEYTNQIKKGTKPGQIVGILDNGGILVSCKNGEILGIYRVQEDHQSETWASEWVRESKVEQL